MFEFDMIQSGLVILAILAAGDVIARKTGSVIPAILVSGLIYMGLLWCGIIPREIASESGYTGLVTLAICLIILGMGSSTSFAELKKNKTTVALAASVFLVQLGSIIGVVSLVYGLNTAIGCLPGGSNVAIMVQQRANELEYGDIAVLTAMLFSFKALVSGPIVSVLIKKEVRQQLAAPERPGAAVPDAPAPEAAKSPAGEPAKLKKALSRVFYRGCCRSDESFYVTLLRMYCVCFIAGRIELITGVSKYVFCLLLGIIMTELGFLHKDDLERTGMKNFLLLILMTTVLNGFSGATPELLSRMCVPMAVSLSTEAVSVFIASRIIGRAMGVSRYLASAIGYQGMMGFPLNLMISEEVINSLTDDSAMRERLNASVSTRVVLAGFTNTTILSVLAAGLLIGLMN